MSNLRFTVAQLIALVVFVGLGFALLRNANDFWASVTFSLAMLSISSALVGALLRRERDRAAWIGFAVFGWTEFFICQLPARQIGSLWVNQPLFADWVLRYLYNVPPFKNDYTSYYQVGRSLDILLFGLVGSIIGRLVTTKDEQPKR